MSHTFKMLKWNEMRSDQWRQKPDEVIMVQVDFGAENATAKEFAFKVDKIELLDLFCRHRSL